jgi:hypothetical protein
VRELTADDLKDLGVNLVGHRRRLLGAIAALRGNGDHAPSAPATQVAPVSAAERRQLTVLFCDLVGSTALSSHLDPEDMRQVIAAYHRAVTEIVTGFDGFVAKYMGDGVLAYFGYPRAHEDDAERAVRAGLSLVDAVGRREVCPDAGEAVRVNVSMRSIAGFDRVLLTPGVTCLAKPLQRREPRLEPSRIWPMSDNIIAQRARSDNSVTMTPEPSARPGHRLAFVD